MSLYLAYANSIEDRHARAIFHRYTDVWLCTIKGQSFTCFNFSSNPVQDYKKILNLAKKAEFGEYEIFLERGLDEEENVFPFLLNAIHDYVLDKDINIGLITKEPTHLLERFAPLIDFLGINVPKPFDKPLKEERPYVSYKPRGELPLPKARGGVHVLNPSGPSGIRYSKADITKKTKDLSNVMMNSFITMPRENSLPLEKSFNELLLDYLKEANLPNADIYHKGGLSKQVFSKIISSPDMIPTKPTIICLIIGLGLNLTEANRLLSSAGFTLSKSLTFDMVIYKYIKEGVYDLDTINSELNERGLPLLGWKPRD